MNTLTRLGMILLLAICSAARAAESSEPNGVAIAALEAMNKAQGEQFVQLAHPELLQKMRDSVLAQIVTDLGRGKVSREMGSLGVTTLEQAKALPPEKVARITVERMRDGATPELRAQLRDAKFSVLKATKEDANTQLLQIGMELKDASGARNQSFEVRVKKFASAWKFYGHAQVMAPPPAAK